MGIGSSKDSTKNTKYRLPLCHTAVNDSTDEGTSATENHSSNSVTEIVQTTDQVPPSYRVIITGKTLSEAVMQKGNRQLAPKFEHASIVSLRVWSSKHNAFVRIRVGAGVFDDTPLIAISHTWAGAVDYKTPWKAEAYTAIIYSAAAAFASGKEWPNYYIWLDYLCTDQTNQFEMREATFKMAWVYSAATVTLVVLDENLSHTDPNFWSNRVWTLQEETLSKELVFMNRAGCVFDIKEVKVESKDDPTNDKVGLRHTSYTFRTWNNTENIKVAENRGIQPFRQFWPIVMNRNGEWLCDRVYASQYCSNIKSKLEIRYDLEYHLVLASYIQRLIEDGDTSCTGISTDCPVPGWGCTTVFGISEQWRHFEVDGALGFIGGFGVSGDLVPEMDEKWPQLDSLPKQPVIGLVVDRTVTLAQIEFNGSFQNNCPLINTIKAYTHQNYESTVFGLSKTLLSIYWRLLNYPYPQSMGLLLTKSYFLRELKSAAPGTAEHDVFQELQKVVSMNAIEQADSLLQIIAFLLWMNN